MICLGGDMRSPSGSSLTYFANHWHVSRGQTRSQRLYSVAYWQTLQWNTARAHSRHGLAVVWQLGLLLCCLLPEEHRPRTTCHPDEVVPPLSLSLSLSPAAARKICCPCFFLFTCSSVTCVVMSCTLQCLFVWQLAFPSVFTPVRLSFIAFVSVLHNFPFNFSFSFISVLLHTSALSAGFSNVGALTVRCKCRGLYIIDQNETYR